MSKKLRKLKICHKKRTQKKNNRKKGKIFEFILFRF